MPTLFPIDSQDHNAAPREQWLAAKLAALPAGYRILDAGAGEQDKKQYCPHLHYVAQDFAMYDGQGDGVAFQHGKWNQSQLDITSDISAIPEPDSSFDAILCSEVFEHLPDPLQAVKEFSRLLKTGGELILTAPFCACTHFSPYFFSTGFSPYWYKKHLPNAEFEILELTPNGNFCTYLLQELNRLPTIAHKYAPVPFTDLEQSGLLIVKSLLSKMLAVDKGSHEFLAFGYHVHAKRI